MPFKLKRILIIRLSAIGDVILTTPLIRMIKNRFSNVQIDFLIKAPYEELLQNHPLVNRLLCFSPEGGSQEIFRVLKLIRQNRYDAVIDLQKNLRSFLFRLFSGAIQIKKYHHQRWKRFMRVRFRKNFYQTINPISLRYLNALKDWQVEDDGKGLDLYPPQEASVRIGKLFSENSIQKTDPIIILAPGASKATKRWPSERYAQAGDAFHKKGYQVVVIGGSDDKVICQHVVQLTEGNIINFAGKLSLGDTMSLLALTDLLITNDTGIMHMGSALAKHLIAVFGPTTSHLGFFPFRASSKVLEKELSCRPCSFHGTVKCPKDHFLCMLNVEVKAVLDAAAEWNL